MNLKMNPKPELIYRNAVIEGVRYVKDHPELESMVLGISGGVDSAVTAALARAVADKTGIRLIGYVLPLPGNDEAETARACGIANAFCAEYELAELDKVYKAMSDMVLGNIPAAEPSLGYKIRAGNIKARTRMTFLYDQAQKHRGMVLSTDNYTELLLGFWTLHGDVGDFGFIQELWKTEVYYLARYIADEDPKANRRAAMLACFEAKPTDGLGVSDSDIDQIMPDWRLSKGSYRDAYRKVDEILIGYLTGESDYNETHPTIAMHLRTEFKRRNPVNIPRDMLFWTHNTEAV